MHKFDTRLSSTCQLPGGQSRLLCPTRLRTICERVVYRHGAMLLILRVRMGNIARRFRPHGG